MSLRGFCFYCRNMSKFVVQIMLRNSKIGEIMSKKEGLNYAM